MERKKVKLSEIPQGEPIPNGIEIVNDYPTEFMRRVINHSTALYIRADKKIDTAKRLVALALAMAGAALGIAIAALAVIVASL